jgi:hypothetical protein
VGIGVAGTDSYFAVFAMSKNIVIIIILFSLGVQHLAAQKYDFNWVLGTYPLKGDLLNFSDYDLKISLINKTVPFFITNTTMSSSSGQNAFSFNGWGIQDAQFDIMDNSDSLKLGSIPDLYDNFGSPLIQGSIALPSQVDTNLLLLIYWDEYQYIYTPDSSYVAPFHLYMAVINKSYNNNKGKVIKKNILLVSDTFANAGITATKHANGRDWWVIVPEIISNKYQTFLISGDSLSQLFSQAIGVVWPPFVDITSQSLFSQSGAKYLRFSDQVGLQVFDFDRCSGLLANSSLINFEFEEGFFSGLAMSKDDRFVYVTDLNNLYQYDMEASNIQSTKTMIGAYDGYKNPYDCDFLNPQLAPDGKIYLNSNGGCKNLHVIEHPEREGLACDFKQHGIALNIFTAGGLPNMPNYRLGPIDGSICDSLGIDNIPLAAFRYDKDGTGLLKIEFTDLSDYDPENWAWNFGDGHVSSEQYPIHLYDSAGIYNVCLTVSNQNGSNTYCKTLQLNTSNTIDYTNGDNSIYYAFEYSQFRVQCTDLIKLQVLDVSGHILVSSNHPSSSIDLSHLEKGVYFWHAVDHNGILRSGKFVKI